MNQDMIIYISQVTKPLNPAEVKQIAVSAAEKNQKADITGLLLQVGNYFVQVLEGQSQILSPLLKKIERDERHTGLRIIYQAADSPKMFAQWNMGFFNIEEYYQANRLDVIRLRRYTEEMFATRETSKEAIIQIIRSMPVLMQSWQVEKPGAALASVS